jgi:N-acetylmuramoyl-L-alanine amidase
MPVRVAGLLIICILFTSFQPGKKTFGVHTVVIDAGHGGHDSGCLGKKTKEKDVALGIALKLGGYIESHFPEVKVLYTRKTDEFVELHKRADIANNAHADLFICIHCNSACTFDRRKKKEICNPETDGVETWVMGLHKSEANLEVSKRENEVVLLEKDYTKQYDGFDPNSPEANIIFSLYQNTFLDQSLRIASYIQNEMKQRGRGGRGVKQAGFLVLYKTSMPSILIETGFLSNPSEESYLASQKGQEEMALSIYKAFKTYKLSFEPSKNPVDFGVSRDRSENDSTVPNPKTDSADKIHKTETIPAKNAINVKADSVKPKEATPNTVGKKTVTAIETTPPKPAELQWGVQFISSPVKIAKSNDKFRGLQNIREDSENGLFKYSTANIDNMDSAVAVQDRIRQMGYKDAFVVAFYNNKKISVKEALELNKKK